MSATKTSLDDRVRWAARAKGGDLHTALLEAYWIIDVVPGDSTVINRLKEAITDAILSGETVRLERAFDEAQIEIGSQLSSAFAF